MSRFIDLIGKKFRRLIVIKRVDNDRQGRCRWLCKCDCGKETIVVGYNLRNNHTKSCGCLNIEHGHVANGKMTITYQSWNHMKQRCTNPNNGHYKNYGGRGITVCGQWLKFENFLDDMGERPSTGHSIDRKKKRIGIL